MSKIKEQFGAGFLKVEDGAVSFGTDSGVQFFGFRITGRESFLALKRAVEILQADYQPAPSVKPKPVEAEVKPEPVVDKLPEQKPKEAVIDLPKRKIK